MSGVRLWGASVAALLMAATASAGPPPAAFAASWVAVDTVAGSGLGSSLETWESTVVDYDRDGDQDVWVGYHDQGGRLFRNSGTGSYTRVAAGAWPRVNAEGMIPDRHLCAWADVDRNGLVDAYCSAGRGAQNLVKTGKDNELWLQTSNGQFEEVGTAWGVGDVCGRSHYVAFLNANGDAYPDLFVGNASPRAVTGDPCDDPGNGLTSEESKLFLNQSGGGGFRAVTAWGIRGYGGTRCAEVVDFNRDGWHDLLVCGGTATKLYRNNAGAGFTDIAAANGLGVNISDADFGDLDGDGDEDLVTSAWGRFDYRLNNGGTFAAAESVHAVPGSGGRAVALGDAEGDGDLDIYALVSNVVAGTNPDDVVLRNNALRFTPLTIPRASGIGDAVVAMDGNRDRRSEFLVLNGVETSGPTQRIELRFQ